MSAPPGQEQTVEQVEDLVGVGGDGRVRRQHDGDRPGSMERRDVGLGQEERALVPDTPPGPLERRANSDHRPIHDAKGNGEGLASILDGRPSRRGLRNGQPSRRRAGRDDRAQPSRHAERLEPAVLDDLLAAIRRVAGDPGVRCVVIRGAGRGFSSGADLRAIAADEATGPDGRPDVGQILVERYHPIIEGIRRMPKPVIAAVHGPAVGIGLSLALACDLVLAAESAYFLLAFVKIGLVPDGGASIFVPSRIGFARAAEMAMLGERVTAPLRANGG